MGGEEERASTGNALDPRLLVGLAAWAGLCAWLVSGFAPGVDLPAHGAQLQTMVEIPRGAPDVRAHYALHFPIGYGLPYWLFLPLAYVTSGRLCDSSGALARDLPLPSLRRRSCCAHRGDLRRRRCSHSPLAFNFSYWYGLVSGLFAQPLAILALAAFLHAVTTGRRRWLVAASLGAVLCMLAHLIAFAALALFIAVAAIVSSNKRRALLYAVVALHPPWRWLCRMSWSLPAGPWCRVGSRHKLRRGRPPQLVLSQLSTRGAALDRRAARSHRSALRGLGPSAKQELNEAAVFVAAVALYFATPKTLSGIFLVAMRLPVFAAMLALPLVPWTEMPRRLRTGLWAITMVSLLETVIFHVRFKHEVAGLEAAD